MPGRQGLLASLFAEYVNKKTAPYIIWTVIALVGALFFLLTRSPGKESGGERADGDGSRSGRPASRSRKTVCVSLDGTLFRKEDGVIIDEAIIPFLELCAGNEVFAIALAKDDAREEEVKLALEAVGMFEAGLRRHRLMFCSSSEGCASMVRQLQPSMHFEGTQSVAAALEGKVPMVQLVDPAAGVSSLGEGLRSAGVL
eukprot:TRINITY_DN85988_c0_g1_i1.p1 TRINITY_DN85988_c0_g1~~TRINITY_DN85988_c0_g1_i1.p1  ORF type:complete len:228 (-),score=48.67 TRINITY_DN85988_c0_g1_i1:132-728(-)